jgi:hypothetical protein
MNHRIDALPNRFEGRKQRFSAKPARRFTGRGWTMRIASLLPAGLVILVTSTLQAAEFHDVTCEGTYRAHLQGVCVGGDAIFWSFTTQLVKTDLDGRLLKQVPVANHHGDLCFLDGKLFVAVNLGRFNDPKGNADSWIYVYHGDDLSLVSKHRTPEVLHGAGGVGARGGRFFVVGGLPDDVEENYIYDYDGSFNFIRKHVVMSGHTHLGIQTATFALDRWWLGCYGTPKILLVTDSDFRMIGCYEFDCSLGIAGIPDGRFLTAEDSGKPNLHAGRLRLATVDEKAGLRIVGPSQAKQRP